MIKIPPRRVKLIVEPWGTVSVNDVVFAVPKEYVGKEVYITISATIEPVEQVDTFKKLISEYFRTGGTLEDLHAKTETPRSTLGLILEEEDRI